MYSKDTIVYTQYTVQTHVYMHMGKIGVATVRPLEVLAFIGPSLPYLVTITGFSVLV